MRLELLGALSTFLIAACDPAGAVVINNNSSQQFVVRAIRSQDDPDDWYLVTPATRVGIGENKILDLNCAPIYRMSMRGVEFPGGGEFTIDASGSVTFGAGSVAIPPKATETDLCRPPVVPTPESMPGLQGVSRN